MVDYSTMTQNALATAKKLLSRKNIRGEKMDAVTLMLWRMIVEKLQNCTPVTGHTR